MIDRNTQPAGECGSDRSLEAHECHGRGEVQSYRGGAINPHPGTPGHFIFVGTGSHRALESVLTACRDQAFAGATSVPYPLLEATPSDICSRLI